MHLQNWHHYVQANQTICPSPRNNISKFNIMWLHMHALSWTKKCTCQSKDAAIWIWLRLRGKAQAKKIEGLLLAFHWLINVPAQRNWFIIQHIKKNKTPKKWWRKQRKWNDSVLKIKKGVKIALPQVGLFAHNFHK